MGMPCIQRLRLLSIAFLERSFVCFPAYTTYSLTLATNYWLSYSIAYNIIEIEPIKAYQRTMKGSVALHTILKAWRKAGLAPLRSMNLFVNSNLIASTNVLSSAL